jgi:trimeric autotransporter adhesin
MKIKSILILALLLFFNSSFANFSLNFSGNLENKFSTTNTEGVNSTSTKKANYASSEKVKVECPVTASADLITLNRGQGTNLTYTGCEGGSVSWYDGETPIEGSFVNPIVTTTYTARCFFVSDICNSDVVITVIQCAATPSASLTTIEVGQETVLSYTGCETGTVNWNNGAGAGNNITVSPASSTNYTASCTLSGTETSCQNSVFITVNTCTVTAGATSTTINRGQSTTLTYTGCGGFGTVYWTQGVTGVSSTVSPTENTTYAANCNEFGSSGRGTGSGFCTSDVLITVVQCSLTASASPANINAGQSSTLSYTGCVSGSVSWNAELGSGNTVSPSTTTTYRATCTPEGGGSTCTSDVTVNVTSCSVTASASPININAGQSSTLSYTGCVGGSVSWNTDLGSGNTVSPSTTTTYRATCTPEGGGSTCTSDVTVNVTSCSVTASASPININAGQSSTLSYTGCVSGSVSWNAELGSGNTVSPSTTTTYRATCTPEGGGSTCTSDVTVNVTSCSVTASASPSNINAGQSSTLSYTGCVGGSVSWNAELGSGNTVSPSTTTTYRATCTPEGGGSTCTSDVTVNVSSCNIGAYASPSNIDAGSSSTLFFEGCSSGSVTWDNGAGTGNNVSVSPTITTTYTATCTPEGGGSVCTSQATVSVSDLCNISVSSSQANIAIGMNSTLTANNCTGTVSWSNGLGTGTSKVVYPITTTTYTATCQITPSYSCSASTTIIVDPKPFNIAQVNVTQPKCNNSKTGSIQVYFDRFFVSGESYGRLKLMKNGATVGTYNFQANVVQTNANLDAGTYYFEAEIFTNTNIQTAFTSGYATLNEPAPVDFTLSVNDVKCLGGKDGVISINASGGSGVYVYYLNVASQSSPFNEGTNHYMGGLTAGNYTVRVSDNLGCGPAPKTIKIEGPSSPVQLKRVGEVEPKGFFTTDGSLTMELVNGTSPLSKIEWYDANGNQILSSISSDNSQIKITETLSGIGKGTYKVVGYDYYNCQVTSMQVLKAPDKIEITAKVDSVKCFSDATGSITVTAKGGVLTTTKKEYTYIYYKVNADGSKTKLTNATSKAESLKSGQFIIEIEDANGIKAESPVSIFEPSKLEILVQTLTPNFCPTSDKGIIKVDAKGGIAPYVFTWDDSSISSSKRTDLKAKTYQSIVTDKNACQTKLVINVLDNSAQFVPKITYTEPSCFGKCDASLSVKIDNGLPPYKYQWQILNINTTQNTINGICAEIGSTKLVVEDSLGCIINSDAVMFTTPAPRPTNLATVKEVCPSKTFELNGTVTWGVNYAWKTPNNKSPKTAVITGDTVGVYTLLVEDNTGCFGRAIIEVIPNKFVNNFFSAISEAPKGKEVVFIDLTEPFPTAISWVYPASAAVVSQSPFSIGLNFSQTGIFNITQLATVDNCVYRYTKEITIVEKVDDGDFPPPSGFTPIEFAILSNPITSGELNLKLLALEQENFEVIILDLDAAKTIFKQKYIGKVNDTLKIPIQENAHASYLVRIQTENQLVSKRFTIIR